MMVWVDVIAVLICSIIGTVVGLILMMRPLTNIISYKVHRKIMRQVNKAEDEFARRKKV